MTPQEIINKIAPKLTNPDITQKLNAVYRIELSGPTGGTWIVDTRPGTAGVRQADEQAACTIKMQDTHFVDMATGKLGAQMAFMTGKLKIAGDMGLALKLGQLLKD